MTTHLVARPNQEFTKGDSTTHDVILAQPPQRLHRGVFLKQAAAIVNTNKNNANNHNSFTTTDDETSSDEVGSDIHDSDDDISSSCSFSSDGSWDSDLEEMESWMFQNSHDPILANGQLLSNNPSHLMLPHVRRPLIRQPSTGSLPSRHSRSLASSGPPRVTTKHTSSRSRHHRTNDKPAKRAPAKRRGSGSSSKSDTLSGRAVPTSSIHGRFQQAQAQADQQRAAAAASVQSKREVKSPQDKMSPEQFLGQFVQAFGYNTLKELEPDASSFWVGGKNSIDTVSYPQAATAARTNDLAAMKRLLHSGCDLHHCCNKYGESIVHIACRRGNYKILKYLIKAVKVNIRLQDDYGKTPLHDAAWTESPNFDSVELLLRVCPDLIFARDKRGHLAVSYIPKAARMEWIQFFMSRPDLIEAGIASTTSSSSNKKKSKKSNKSSKRKSSRSKTSEQY